MKKSKIYCLSILVCLLLNSCVLDTKPWGYSVKNSTNDTLLIDLTESKTLSDDMYWGTNPEDTLNVIEDDTITVNINGRKISIFNFYRVLPDSNSLGFFDLYSDTFYVYAIKWSIATHYTLDEIRKKKLYDKRVVAKKDFINHKYEYKINKPNHEYK